MSSSILTSLVMSRWSIEHPPRIYFINASSLYALIPLSLSVQLRLGLTWRLTAWSLHYVLLHFHHSWNNTANVTSCVLVAVRQKWVVCKHFSTVKANHRTVTLSVSVRVFLDSEVWTCNQLKVLNLLTLRFTNVQSTNFWRYNIKKIISIFRNVKKKNLAESKTR